MEKKKKPHDFVCIKSFVRVHVHQTFNVKTEEDHIEIKKGISKMHTRKKKYVSFLCRRWMGIEN